ncbi:MAG: DUF389 domain-containing protein [Anaerolineae bacterium]
MTHEHPVKESPPYRIVIAVGEPDDLALLVAIAAPLARARGGCVVPLRIGRDEERPNWLIIPDEASEVVDPPVMMRGNDIGAGILEYVRETQPDLLLLHWKGTPSRGRYLLGRTLDPVIQYAPCNVAVLQHAGVKPAQFAERLRDLRHVLVPSGGGPNAEMALRLGLDMGPGAEVTALRVADRSLGPTGISVQRAMLRSLLEGYSERQRLRPTIVLAGDVVEGVLQEAERGYDLILVGATRESLVDRLLFGNLPQQVALRSKVPVLIVRQHDQAAMATLRHVGWRVLRALPQLTMDERVAVYRVVRRNARTGADYFTMIVLSAAIASLGLMLNSAGVVIGAMIMAPLMSAILAIALSVVQGDVWLMRTASRTFLLGFLLVLAVSAVVGLIIPGPRPTAEMLSRTTPTLLDLAVALASGAAAAYAISRRDVTSALPGVAIAVALVPPLATVGITAAKGHGDLALGALLLFVTNFAAIVAAATLILLWMGFHPESSEATRSRAFRSGVAGTLVLLGAVTLVLGTLTVKTIQSATLERRIERALQQGVSALDDEQVLLSGWRLVDRQGDVLHLSATLETTRDLSRDDARGLQRVLALELNRPVSLSLIELPTERFEPLRIEGE